MISMPVAIMMLLFATDTQSIFRQVCHLTAALALMSCSFILVFFVPRLLPESLKNNIKALKRQLKAAIAKQDYETAARIRDKIKAKQTEQAAKPK